MRNCHCILPLKPGGNASWPGPQASPNNGSPAPEPGPQHRCEPAEDCSSRLSSEVGLSCPPHPSLFSHWPPSPILKWVQAWRRERKEGRGRERGRGAGGARRWSQQGGYWVMASLAQYGSVYPSSAFPPLTVNSCPAWHHVLCQVLSHLTRHLVLTTRHRTCILYSHVHRTVGH